MATVNKNGTNGTNGTSGASPTAGTLGGDGTFSQSGKIGTDSTVVNATGGNGGTGGNGTAVPGAIGGNGGNAGITFNGNILNAPAGTTLAIDLNATGGNGGLGGTGTTTGATGKGGNATITASGNIFQPSKVLTSIELDAIAVGGTGSTFGNASSTISGNIFQTSKATTVVTVDASAGGSGTNNAVVNGNVVQGNISNVTMEADAFNGTATLNGNIIQTNATNTGTVLVEASGSHIAITQNKFNLGLQTLDFTINPASPYDTTITGNTFAGTGSNAFVFADSAHPGPNTDTVTIDLGAGTFVFDGEASDAFTGFTNVAVSGTGVNATLIGTTGNETLTGGDGNDTLTGGKGNDTLNGGNGTDTAVYAGNHTDYTIAVNTSGNGTVADNVTGRDGADTLTSIEKIQFADGVYNTATGLFTGINHAPVLDASKSPALATETLNAPAPTGAVGTLVSSLVDLNPPAGGLDNVTDPDAGALTGIALTGTDTANGTWFYSTNNGANWTAVGAVTDSSALLLAADAGTRLYFQPTAGYAGTDNSAVTFRAWDQTSGSNGQSGVNVSGANDGGTTAFSTASDTASLTISSVNHAPVLDTTKSPMLTAELEDAGTPTGAVGTLVSSLVDLNPPVGGLDNVTDSDAGALTGIALTGTDTANGTWFYSTNNGTSWNAVGAVSDSSALLLAADANTRLYFDPSANYNGSDSSAVTFRAWDQTSGSNGQSGVNVTTNGGTTAFSTANDTAGLTITAVNDAPVLDATKSPVLTSEATNAGAPVGAVGTLVSSLVDLNPPAGGLDNVTDVDSGAVTGIALTGTDTTNGTWYYSTNNGTSWNTVGTVSDAGALLLAADAGTRLYFDPAAGYGGTDNSAITFRAWDQTSGSNGGTANVTANGGTTAFSSASDTAALTVIANNAPVLDATKTPVLATEGENASTPTGMVGTLVSSLVDLNPPAGGLDNVTDADAGAQTGIALTGADTTNGTWFYSTNNGTTWNAVGTVSNSSALLLSADANTRLYFQPSANFSGTVSNAVTFRAWDQTSGSNGGTANTTANGGSTAFSAATDTANITIDPVRIGNTYYATINAALAAAQTGDTIVVSPGTYDESLLINKSVSIVGDGPAGSVIINGTFAQDNNIPVGTDVATWLKTAGGYTGDTGVTVNADNVSLTNLTVQNFKYDIGTQDNAENVTPFADDNSVTNLNLTGVTMKDAVTGFQKDDGTTLTGLNIQGGAVSDTEFGVYLANDTYDAANPNLHDAVNTTINGVDFSNILWKGIYAETLQGNTSIDNVTMNDVGNFGGTPVNGPNLGKNGNGIDINLKFHTYVGNLEISGFDLTNVGNTPGQSGAIVVEGRDDPGSSSYDTASGGHSADTSGLNVTIGSDTTTNTIDGSTTGVRVGELGKANPSLNLTGPAVIIDGVIISNTSDGEIENHSQSVMTVIGDGTDNTYMSDQTAVSTGELDMFGMGGDDYLVGGTGNDVLQGGTGNDTLDGGSGGNDTADYSDATSNGLVVSLMTGTSSGGGLGNDTLFDIQNLQGSDFNDTLVGDDGNNVLAGGDGNDILYGHGGDNVLSGGAGTDVAYYTGLETDYGLTVLGTSLEVTGGPEDVDDTMFTTDVERLKFLSPSHVADVDNNGVGNLVSQFHDVGNNNTDVAVDGTTVATVGYTQSVVGMGQFNPDGVNGNRKSDILLQDSSTGALSVLYYDNANTLHNQAFAGIGVNNPLLNASNYNANWKVVATGDFNGDASSDILLQNQSTKAVEIFTVKANATDAIGTVDSVSTVTAPAGTGWNPIATGDFNGDGKSDILWQNSMSKAIEISLTGDSTTATTTFQNTPTAQAASGLTVIGTGDFNGDGFSDILFQNAAGQAVVWFMYGDSHVGTKTVAKPGANFSIAGAEDVDGNGYSDIVWKDTSGNVAATTFSSPSSLVSTTVLNPNLSLGATPASFSLAASTGGG